jgi:hypothetical protein
MEDTQASLNPYGSMDETILPPFIGRESYFARIHQHISDPATQHAIAFSGRRHVGKTAFLRQFAAAANPNHICVYIPLKELKLDGGSLWLRGVARLATDAVNHAGFAPDEIDDPPDDETLIREWFTEMCLASLFHAIRAHRKLIFLFDDVERLATAAEELRVPRDCFEFLRSLAENPQLEMAVSIGIDYEDALDMLYPLVDPNDVHRLTSLNREDTIALMRLPAQGFYTVDDAAVNAIYEATGGEPALLQRFGAALYTLAESGDTTIQADDIKAITTQVYANSKPDFQLIWATLDNEERLTLTALAELYYENPLRRVDVPAIETWLANSDHPVDVTTINASIRGLDYREIVTGTANNTAIASGLFRTWLLENAGKPDERAPKSTQNMTTNRNTMIIVAIVILVALLLAAFVISNLGNESDGAINNNPIPTVTLAGNE